MEGNRALQYTPLFHLSPIASGPIERKSMETETIVEVSCLLKQMGLVIKNAPSISFWLLTAVNIPSCVTNTKLFLHIGSVLEIWKVLETTLQKKKMTAASSCHIVFLYCFITTLSKRPFLHYLSKIKTGRETLLLGVIRRTPKFNFISFLIL